MRPGEIGSFRELIEHCKERTAAKWDNFIVITGKPGSGKSNLARYVAENLDPTFHLGRTAFSGLTYVNCCQKASPNQAVIWDEIVEGGTKGETVTKEGRAVRKHLMTGRSLRIHSIACATHLDDFQSYAAKFRANWWIYVPSRGRAIVHHPNTSNPFPGAKVSYTALFEFPFPEMEPSKLAAYEMAKENWRTIWNRDSEKYMKSRTAADHEEEAVRRRVKRLAWLPASVEAKERVLAAKDSGLKPWEKKARQAIMDRS